MAGSRTKPSSSITCRTTGIRTHASSITSACAYVRTFPKSMRGRCLTRKLHAATDNDCTKPWTCKSYCVAMFSLRLALASVAVMAASVALSRFGPSLTAAAQASPPRVERCPGVTPQVEPKSMVIACGDGSVYASHLAWRSWGSQIAETTGLVAANDGKPYCARGTFHTYTATFVLSDLRGVQGQRLYLRFSISHTGKRPYHGEAPRGDKTFSETIATSTSSSVR
jgi:hypothetical protein